jgi:hypothetical protein
MTTSRGIAAILVSLCLVGCGNLQAVRVASIPEPVRAGPVTIAEERPSKDAVMPRAFEVPGKSLFIQQTSGGSVAAGVLFGPLGVLANVANIDRLTRAMGESAATSSLLTIDAKAEALQAIGTDGAAPQQVPSGATPIELKPYIVYFVADEKAGVDVLVHLLAETAVQRDGKPVVVKARYAAYLRETLPLEALQKPMTAERLDQLRADVRASYKELYEQLKLDRAQPLPSRKIAWVKSRVMGIGAGGEIDRTEAGHFVVRSRFGDNHYSLVLFESDKQYEIDNGPVERQKP